MKFFADGVSSLVNSLANMRQATATNVVVSDRVKPDQLREIYKTGLGSKIIRIKSGYALQDAWLFDDDKHEDYYNDRLATPVRDAWRFALGFGRGIIVLYNKGDDLSAPHRGTFDPQTVKMKIFSGDMVTATSADIDLMSDRYYKPDYYTVRGVQIHWTRVIDFTYYKPPELDAPHYQYGGLSEFELVYSQIINDGIVERAAPAILDKNSTVFYKVRGFRDLLNDKKEEQVVRFFHSLENLRSVYGAGIVDADDEIQAVNQTLTNLADTDMITLRRLAMVTGIPLAWLVGENVKGLNSTGDNERQIFREMIRGNQSEYILGPVNELMTKLGMDTVTIQDNQDGTPLERVAYEKTILENAKMLWEMSEDHAAYLEDKGLVQRDKFREFFEPSEDELL